MLRDYLIDNSVVKFGNFTLTSGKKSDYYIDIKEASTNPEILEVLGIELSHHISSKKIAGMELGAVPLLISTSLQLKIPYIIIRKTERTHGTGKRYIGQIVSGEMVDVIDDVATTGGSILKSVNILRGYGAIVKNAICIVDREEGAELLMKNNNVNLISLVKISELR